MEVRDASAICWRRSAWNSSESLDCGCMIVTMECRGSRFVDHLAFLIASSVCRETSPILHELLLEGGLMVGGCSLCAMHGMSLEQNSHMSVLF